LNTSIDKVYSGNIYGDFAGGNVDIISKDYKGKGFFKIDIGSKGTQMQLPKITLNCKRV
jgi:hypothetical protein